MTAPVEEYRVYLVIPEPTTAGAVHLTDIWPATVALAVTETARGALGTSVVVTEIVFE
jgi:hypothetical protein